MKQLPLFALILKMRQVWHGQDKLFAQDYIAGQSWSPDLKAGNGPLGIKLFTLTLDSSAFVRLQQRVTIPKLQSHHFSQT